MDHPKIDSWRVVAEQLHRQKNENKQRSTCNSGSARKKLRQKTSILSALKKSQAKIAKSWARAQQCDA
jgi:hypothetical protein